MVGPEPPQKCMTTRMPGRAATVAGTYSHIWSPPGFDPKFVTCCSDDVRAEAGRTLMAAPATATVTTATRVTRSVLILKRLTFLSPSMVLSETFGPGPELPHPIPNGRGRQTPKAMPWE